MYAASVLYVLHVSNVVCTVVCVACRVLRFNNVSLSFKDPDLHYKAEFQWMDTLFVTGKWGCIHRKHR